MESDLEAFLERIASGIEKLASDPQVEIEAGPPICPACGTFDPVVASTESEGRGPLSQFVIDCYCTNCNARIYGVVESYSMHQDRNTAILEMQERERAGFFNGQTIS